MSLENRTQNSNGKVCQIAALCFSLALGLGLLILSLRLPGIAKASGPEEGSDQENGPVIGLASNALECLAVGNDLPYDTLGVVRLTWQGQAERARLILSVSGAEAPHTIKLNGQPVAQAPIYPEGQPCGDGEVFYLDLPPGVVVQGDNLIEITNDALSGDNWTAANVRLEVLGDIMVPTAGSADSGQISPTDTGTSIGSLGFAEVFSFDLTFESSYDGSSQHFLVQIPVDNIDDCNTIPSTPLVVYVHGRSSSMYEPFDNGFNVSPKDKGWLLASPELHGSSPIAPSPPGKYAYASLESQYDIVDTVNYMVEHCNVKLDQIYLVGYSMGGQIDTVTAAKFPHIFAAVFDNKGPTDMGQWYYESTSYHRSWMRLECHINEVEQDPTENPFCYQRRSGINFARNYTHIPISMTHSVSDTLVPIHHSRDLRDAINSYGPDHPASVYEDTIVGPTCGEPYHCYIPDPMAVLNFLEPFTLNSNPAYINIATDESKSYHWLNVAQTGGDHWSQVEVVYYPISATVTATISDSQPLTLGFNLGSTPIIDIIEQPGMGLPATTYLVQGGGNNDLHDYTSGYLTTTLVPGQFSLTISAVEIEVSADPSTVTVQAGQIATSTITAVVRDHLNNPVPNGTLIEFSTTEGTFPNASSTYTAPVTEGQATTTLTLDSDADLAEVVASVWSVTGSTSVDMIYSANIYLPVIIKSK